MPNFSEGMGFGFQILRKSWFQGHKEGKGAPGPASAARTDTVSRSSLLVSNVRLLDLQGSQVGKGSAAACWEID